MNSTKSYCEPYENIQHILVALDASESSHRVVQYVASFFSNNSEVSITLLHMSTPEEWLSSDDGYDWSVQEKVRFDMEEELTHRPADTTQSRFER